MGQLFQVLRRLLICSGVVMMFATGIADARDPVAGKSRAATCAICHGTLGVSRLPNAPHLAGQPAIYLVEQLKNYRSGKRQSEMMNVIANPLSDTEISDLAAWYESIVIEAREK